MPYLFDKNFYTDNAKLVRDYHAAQRWLRVLNYLNWLVIVFGFVSVLPLVFAPNHDSDIYFVSQVLLQLQLFFSCFAMIYALHRLNRQVKAVQQLLPRTWLLVTHCVLLVLIVVTALGFYVA